MITLLIVIPAVAAILAALGDPKAELAKRAAVAASLACTLLAGLLWARYDLGAGGLQFAERADWIPSFGIGYRLALDGISLPFVLLTPLLTLVSVLASWHETRKGFFALFLVMQAALTGVFAALDLVLFFVFWEVVLIPMFFVIGVWGYENRRYAAIKFVLYSLAGSVLMLVAILATAYAITSRANIPLTFDYEILRANAGVLAQAPVLAGWAFWGFMVAFLIKLPAFPLHTWLPHAHTEAPTAGSIMLAGLLLKMGGYGMLRFNLGLFPEQMLVYQPVLALLAAVGIVYGAYVAMAQRDLKRMVAYSSVSHMGFVLLGIASLSQMGLHGAVYYMVAHALITGLMFMTVGFLSRRTHTREIARMRGMYNAMPILGGLMWLAFLGGLGQPGTAAFVGEFTAMLGAVQTAGTRVYGYVGLAGVVITAGAMLWTIQRVLLGPAAAERPHADDHGTLVLAAATGSADDDHGQTRRGLWDLEPVEIAAAAPLAVLAVVLGLFPPALTPWIDAAVTPLLEAARVLASR